MLFSLVLSLTSLIESSLEPERWPLVQMQGIQTHREREKRKYIEEKMVTNVSHLAIASYYHLVLVYVKLMVLPVATAATAAAAAVIVVAVVFVAHSPMWPLPLSS